jgi:hypothetical protein
MTTMTRTLILVSLGMKVSCIMQEKQTSAVNYFELIWAKAKLKTFNCFLS